MSNEHSPPLASPGATNHRRASAGPQAIQDLFGRRNSLSGQQAATQAYPGPITTAAVQAQRRRLSLTTLGLSGSPNQTSPFLSRPRTESLSSVNSGSVDESPFEDDPPPSMASGASSVPTTPFARRLSFGARALREVRESSGGNGNSNGRPSVHRKASSPPTPRGRGLSSSLSRTPSSLPSPEPLSLCVSSPLISPAALSHTVSPSPSSSVLPLVLAEHFRRHPSDVEAIGDHELTSIFHAGEGYNFAENQRLRAERTSMSGTHPLHPPGAMQPHQRAKSVTIMEPPAREMPKQPRVPDAMQERILKGDFYMD